MTAAEVWLNIELAANRKDWTEVGVWADWLQEQDDPMGETLSWFCRQPNKDKWVWKSISETWYFCPPAQLAERNVSFLNAFRRLHIYRQYILELLS